MYAPRDDRICTLGIPSGGWKQCGYDSLEGWEDAKVSKIGGYPIWHNTKNAPTLEDVKCKICSKTDNVVLVAQIYAPTDNHERSLYIFCCNTRECSLKSEGWMALRNQIIIDKKDKKDEELPNKVEPALDQTPVPTTKPSNKQSVWDFLGDDNSFGSDITSSNDKIGNDEEDLLSLLESRDLSLSKVKPTPTKPPTSKKATGKITKSSKGNDMTNFLKIPTTLPLCKLKEVDEDWDYSMDDEEEVVLDSGMDGAHIDALIATYLKDEDDPEHLKMLNSLGLGGKDINKGAKHSHIEIGEDDDDEDEDDESGRRVNSETGKFRVEMYFQKRISIEPKQVLRYAYDGIPLWITSPNPREAVTDDFLICSSCGTQRVFECQLMPTLLYNISKFTNKKMAPFANESPMPMAAATATNAFRVMDTDLLGHGMDFGVVTVWCCPNSCENASIDGSREVILVQPPPDFV